MSREGLASEVERLRASEGRLRSLLEEVDTAIAIIEVRVDGDDRPVDYRFREANAAFERQSGVDLKGRWVSEYAPDLERSWFETYGHVAKTGEPANFESYASTFERWFDVRAILNMAVNARDAMEGEGRLTILVEERDGIPATRGHAAVEGRFISVAVSDPGGGISDDDLPRVFEPFFTTKEVGKGTGLGLSQVFGFAKQSGGDIVIEGVTGQGATFTLYLPRAENRQAIGDAGLTPPTAVVPSSGGGCVLLVEDNQLVGEFAAQLIGELGYGNMWVPSAQEALALVDANPDKFDMVFSDVVMPGTSGIELAEILRGRFPDLPVVLTSGYSHVLAAEGSHGFELLQKPYTVEGLARVLGIAMAK